MHNTMLHEGDKLISDKGNEYFVICQTGMCGQGEFYTVDCSNNTYLLKWYYKGSITDSKRLEIHRKVKEGAPGKNFIWPIDVIEQEGGLGCVYRAIPKEYKTFGDFLRGKTNPSFETLCNVGINISRCMEELHRCGYIIVAEYDFVFDPNTGEVIITGWDKLFKEEQGYRFMGTARLAAPEVVKGNSNPSRESDLFLLAEYLFCLLMVSHPYEGKKEANLKCVDVRAQLELYGTNAVFIFDPDDDSNRPMPGYQQNAIEFWSLYPVYIQGLFIECFTKGKYDVQYRPTERKWISAIERLRGDIVRCPQCGAEGFVDSIVGKGLCWRCHAGVFSNLNKSTAYTPKSNNVLCNIFDMYPLVWKDLRRFKALLMDFLPQDKLKRNLLYMSVEENIPDRLVENSTVSPMVVSTCQKKLVNACGCSEMLAKEIVGLWIQALNISTENDDLKIIKDDRKQHIFLVIDVAKAEKEYQKLTDTCVSILMAKLKQEAQNCIYTDISILTYSSECKWVCKNENILQFNYRGVEFEERASNLGLALDELAKNMVHFEGKCLEPMIIFMLNHKPSDDYKTAARVLLNQPWYKISDKCALGLVGENGTDIGDALNISRESNCMCGDDIQIYKQQIESYLHCGVYSRMYHEMFDDGLNDGFYTDEQLYSSVT